MARRAVWRPPWFAWSLLGLLALLVIDRTDASRLDGRWALITPVLVLVGVLALRRLWQLPPAATMCAALALTIFSGAWAQIGVGGLPFDRLLLAIVLLQLFLLAPGVARIPRVQVRAVHLLMAFVAIYATVSALAAGTLGSETGLLSLIDLFGLAPYLIFLLAPAIFAGRRERRMLLATLVGVGFYLGLTAIFESLGPHALVFPRYILHADAATPGERAGGPFQSSLAEGFATFSCAVAALIAFVQWREEGRRRLAALGATAVAVSLFGAFVTLERGVWIAALAAGVVVALATRSGRRWLLPGLLCCAIVIGGALLVSPSLSRKTSNRATSQISVWDRENQTYAGLRMIAARPLFGFGWERYRSDSFEYFRQGADYPMYGYKPSNAVQGEKTLPLHDTYLAYAVELGIVGALLWLAALVWGVGQAVATPATGELRQWKLGLLAIGVFFFVVAIFNPSQAPFSVLLLWLWAGVAQGGPSLAEQARRSRSRAGAERRMPAPLSTEWA
ncbi:MAG TPA: O-antigen ligase family protein [Solirubrobacteraceae bacterium]|nr:O-antigen ligase family protein [Solirubrobacteraceae bacterium]